MQKFHRIILPSLLCAVVSLALLAPTGQAQTGRKRPSNRANKTRKSAAKTDANDTKPAPAAPVATPEAEAASPATDPFVVVPRRVEQVAPAPASVDNKPLSYQLRGIIHSVHLQPPVVAVSHENIPGYMEAMTMNFSLKDVSLLKKLKPGDRIEATLKVSQTEGKWWLEDVVVKK